MKLSEALLIASQLQDGESRCSPEEMAELSQEAQRLEEAHAEQLLTRGMLDKLLTFTGGPHEGSPNT
jgi:hypothetical protein